jgi:cytidylate kinase
MIDRTSLEKCLTFIRTQLQPPLVHAEKPPKLAVTISRQTGTGGLVIAQKLAQYLQTQGRYPDRPWTVFDKNLVEEVLKQHNLPKELVRFMPEDRVSQLRDMAEEILGLHPPTWTLVRQTTETILHLAELGNVILVGRGANVITAQLPHVVHVRLVGSLAVRVQRLQKFDHLSAEAARAAILQSDRGRARYLRKNFHKDIDDMLLYDLVINTDRISDEVAAQLIALAALSRCP